MANPEHRTLLKQGVAVWNEWRKATADIRPDLFQANLHGADLQGADLQRANLFQANLGKANLFEANLFEANLFKANLFQANLGKANLGKVHLQGANLQGANLRRANRRGADLGGANFQEADLRGVDLEGANLRGADFDRAILVERTSGWRSWLANIRHWWRLIRFMRIEFPKVIKPPPPPIVPITKPPVESVLLGASAPTNVRPSEEFTVRFVAYLQEFESQMDSILKGLSPRSESHLGIGQCRWQEGVKVTVILSCQYLDITESQQEFEWHSPYQVIPFDVVVQRTAPETTVVLKLDVYIQGIQVAPLRLDVPIHRARIRELIRNFLRSPLAFNKPYPNQRIYQKAMATPATTAFASYASQDRFRVLDCVSTLEISTGMKIFQDCLSLHPGEPWKETLLKKILDSDLFLLFWSKYAKDSQWVRWEWTTALEKRGEEMIQLHPLDAVEEAPPPPELAHLHFGNPIMRIRKSYEIASTNRDGYAG